MLNPIEINFKLDKTIKRELTTELMIRSHDINVIEFHIAFDGLELTADHTVKVLSVFSDTGSQTNVNCEIADGKAIYRPDTSIISQYDYVRNYVYVYHGYQSLDAHLFTYSVDSSEIDKTAIKVKTVYDQYYAELLTEFEARLKDYKDSLPQASDLRAEVDVILDKFKVDSVAKLSQYDADAQQVIADNQIAFGVAESGRQATYEQAEDNRNHVSEQAIVDWEQSAGESLSVKLSSIQSTADASLVRVATDFNARADGAIDDKLIEFDTESNQVLAPIETAEALRVIAEQQRQIKIAQLEAQLEIINKLVMKQTVVMCVTWGKSPSPTLERLEVL